MAKYKLTYIDGLGKDQSSLDLEFGTAMHLGIKAAFDGEDPILTFNMYWSSIESKGLRQSRYSWEQLKFQGESFLDRFMKLHFKKFKPVKIEEQFKIEVAGFPFEGTADFIGLYDGVPSVFDWKTSGARYKHSKLLKNHQLWIYSKAAREVFNFEPQQIGYKVFVKSQESIQTLVHPFSEEKLKSMMTDIESMVKDLSTRQNWPRSPNCFCNFPEICFKGEKLRNE
jgi:CRISPR/Cas system-associated exonuclease Cas4 (RecB family)